MEDTITLAGNIRWLLYTGVVNQTPYNEDLTKNDAYFSGYPGVFGSTESPGVVYRTLVRVEDPEKTKEKIEAILDSGESLKVKYVDTRENPREELVVGYCFGTWGDDPILHLFVEVFPNTMERLFSFEEITRKELDVYPRL